MTDEAFEAMRGKISAYVHKWREILNLNSHRMNLFYERRTHSDGSHTCAITSSSWQYKDHSITFYPAEIAEMSDEEEIELCVIHELAHILLHPITGDATDKSAAEIEKMEYAVTSTAHALLWAYKETPPDEGAKSAKV